MKIPYYVVIKGRGYWQPTRKMRSCGFSLIRCGADGPDAWAIASIWNERWQQVRRGEATAPYVAGPVRQTLEARERAIVYPRGSLGEAFARYRNTPEWTAKQPRTREDWWRGWKRIKPFFGMARPADVTLETISLWREGIERTVSRREAHRTMKIWRALWKVCAAMRYCEREADPSLGVRNLAAKGRSETWTEGEVVRLVKRAWRDGYRGLAAAVAVMWDTQLSPGDVRALTAAQIARGSQGSVFFTERGKTAKPVGGHLSRRATAVLDQYLATFGADLHAEAPIFRTRGAPTTAKGGRPWTPRPYTKDTLTEEFRAVRTAEYGAGERRQLLDLRRSGAVEAIAGDANAEALSHAMGNTLAASNALFETYVPINQATIRSITEARRKGRKRLRDGND